MVGLRSEAHQGIEEKGIFMYNCVDMKTETGLVFESVLTMRKLGGHTEVTQLPQIGLESHAGNRQGPVKRPTEVALAAKVYAMKELWQQQTLLSQKRL